MRVRGRCFVSFLGGRSGWVWLRGYTVTVVYDAVTVQKLKYQFFKTPCISHSIIIISHAIPKGNTGTEQVRTHEAVWVHPSQGPDLRPKPFPNRR